MHIRRYLLSAAALSLPLGASAAMANPTQALINVAGPRSSHVELVQHGGGGHGGGMGGGGMGHGGGMGGGGMGHGGGGGMGHGSMSGPGRSMGSAMHGPGAGPRHAYRGGEIRGDRGPRVAGWEGRRGDFHGHDGYRHRRGAVIVGAPYWWGDDWYDDGYYDDGYADVDVDVDVGPGDGVARCEARYRSFDPATGTFLGYDGIRKRCPYLG